MIPNLLGRWSPSDSTIETMRGTLVRQDTPTRFEIVEGVYAVTGPALSEAQVSTLIEAFAHQQTFPVDGSGHVSSNGRVGSMRATAWSPPLAEALWPSLKGHVHAMLGGSHLRANDYFPTDWYGIPEVRAEHRVWRAVGLSPVLRFMRYERGGEHNTHYDAGYDYGFHAGRRTLLSVVWYLTTCPPSLGGCTRFIEDGQGNIPTYKRNHDDWTRRALEDEVLLSVSPVMGHALVFPHRAAHDVQAWNGDTPRIIIRGDVVFEAES